MTPSLYPRGGQPACPCASTGRHLGSESFRCEPDALICRDADASMTPQQGLGSATFVVLEHCRAHDRGMKSIVVVVTLLVCTGCSTPAATDSVDRSRSSAVMLITRPEGQNDTTWDTDRGHLRVEAGCILVKGRLAVFPFGTRLVDDSTAVQLSDEAEPIALDGTAEVSVLGSEVPIGREGDWDHAMDAANLDRWSECRRRAGISEYADWWLLGQVDLMSTD